MCKQPFSQEEVIQKQTAVFHDELGSVTNIKAKLTVQAKPDHSFICPWAVPFALQEPIKIELEWLEEAGVIEEVMHSEWAVATTKNSHSSPRH